MSAPAAPGALEPLASAPLCSRLPHLGTALDGERMRAHLQRLLLDGTGLVAEACTRPRAELDGGVCWLQFPLRVRTPSGGCHELLVLGALFADPDAAGAFERAALAPVAARWSPSELPRPRASATLEPLGMAVSVFPVNGPLPTLVEATDPRRMAAVLGSPLAGVDLVRLRRSGGAVLLYRPAAGGEDVFGKVGYTESGAVVAGALEALRRSAGGPVVYPRVLGRVAELDLTLIARVPGTRPDLRRSGELKAAVDGAALVAAAIHTSGVAAGDAHTLADELARASGAVAAIEVDAPALAAWLTAALEQAGGRAAGTAAQPPGLAHGDLTPSQLLLDGPRIGVIDFDGICQAEPGFDLGRFLAYLRTSLAKSGNPAADALASRFLSGYLARGGQPAPAERVDAYAVASLVRMAAHCWQQLKPARLRLACSALEAQLGR